LAYHSWSPGIWISHHGGNHTKGKYSAKNLGARKAQIYMKTSRHCRISFLLNHEPQKKGGLTIGGTFFACVKIGKNLLNYSL
jgi:hypothetical protein